MPFRLQDVEAPRISRQSAYEDGKVVSPTHRPRLPLEYIPGTDFCWRLSGPQGHIAAGSIKSLKNPTYAIENRTRNLPTYNLVHKFY